MAQEGASFLVQRVAAGFGYADGAAIAPDGAVLVTDRPNDRILRLASGGPPQVARERTGGATAIGFDARQRMILCQAGARRVVRIEPDGAETALASEFEGQPLNAPNDLAIGPGGHIYFTDPAFGPEDERRKLPFYGVFHLPPKGGLEAVFRSGTRPNGIALAPKGHLLYVAFADERLVRVFDVGRQGAATNGRVFVSGIEGVPAGVKVDSQGRVYVAAAELLVYSPAGRLLHKTKIPETPSNLVIDPASGAIYVTARRSVYRVLEGGKESALKP